MATLNAETILITGASGYMATHIVKSFLEAGYYVRGTVRSLETAEKVRQTFMHHSSRLSFAIVQDIGKEGAFDEAVKGVHGVIHTATPYKVSVQDNKTDLLDPAINGTLNILLSVSRHAPQVKRIVFTGSFVSMLNILKGRWPGHIYSETDWNPTTYESAASKDAPAGMAYAGAKTFAERAAWDFVAKNHPHFDISFILPPMTYGPNLNATASLTNLNASSYDIYRLMTPQTRPRDMVPGNEFFSFVDVRDVAEAHVQAYRRFFVCQGNFTYQHFVNILREKLPEIRAGADTSKSREVLGLRYRTMEDTVVDAAKSFMELERSCI
ncbi:putative NAD dependent epimerase/dehydratase [Aspergillus sclerotioniger CBS 115572]|uniref:Putative NAD dependent epimerase/dehydratase n=1 Tax=Aspergillus sclerotioniger CBS 115572 TaxID=1450535 RepID=A0A317XFX3_9EURO|nr:putative NAD dependent epimerase/dehydratase [Aspergillus sclerotioniger CBS 115572]PWY96058.1 putative NAD dependent epimerase/dehydratase [Aspergillus sclerotioniger CBS 115572]